MATELAPGRDDSNKLGNVCYGWAKSWSLRTDQLVVASWYCNWYCSFNVFFFPKCDYVFLCGFYQFLLPPLTPPPKKTPTLWLKTTKVYLVHHLAGCSLGWAWVGSLTCLTLSSIIKAALLLALSMYVFLHYT